MAKSFSSINKSNGANGKSSNSIKCGGTSASAKKSSSATMAAGKSNDSGYETERAAKRKAATLASFAAAYKNHNKSR